MLICYYLSNFLLIWRICDNSYTFCCNASHVLSVRLFIELFLIIEHEFDISHFNLLKFKDSTYLIQDDCMALQSYCFSPLLFKNKYLIFWKLRLSLWISNMK